MFSGCTALSDANVLKNFNYKPLGIYAMSDLIRGTAIVAVEEEHWNGYIVTSFGSIDGIFRLCWALKTAVIPENILYLPSFSETYLTWIELKATTPPVASSLDSVQAIYVPDTAVDTYKAATGFIAHAAKIKPVSQRPTV